MMLNGFPTMDGRLRQVFAEQSNGHSQHFAGNGYPSTIIAAFIIAIQFCFQEGAAQNEEARPAGDDECEAALHLLNRARRILPPYCPLMRPRLQTGLKWFLSIIRNAKKQNH
jgi:hypothetical protein